MPGGRGGGSEGGRQTEAEQVLGLHKVGEHVWYIGHIEVTFILSILFPIGEEFVDLVSASDALSLEQYKTFSIRIFKANCKGKRSMTREMANPLRVYRKAIPCPKAVYNIRGGDYDDMLTAPSPRPFHTFKFPHITVEVETTPQVNKPSKKRV